MSSVPKEFYPSYIGKLPKSGYPPYIGKLAKNQYPPWIGNSGCGTCGATSGSTTEESSIPWKGILALAVIAFFWMKGRVEEKKPVGALTRSNRMHPALGVRRFRR